MDYPEHRLPYVCCDDNMFRCLHTVPGKCQYGLYRCRPCNRKICRAFGAILSVGLVLLILVFHSTYMQVQEKMRECLKGRFEAGEDLSMNDIVQWTKGWLRDLSEDEPVPNLLPCVKDSVNACQPLDCRDQIPWDVHDRIRREMFDVGMMLTMRHIIRIQCFSDQVPENDVILVTAASSNQFEELMAWVTHINNDVLPGVGDRENTSVLVVDLGLDSLQRAQIQKECQCQVISFPFWSFPPHVTLESNCSSWRPIVIRAFLPRVRHSLVFMDLDVRINDGQLRSLLSKVESTKILFGPPQPIAFPVNTQQETFDYFNAKPCSFYPFPEVQSSFGIFRNISFVNRVLIEPWTNCALTEECVCPFLSSNSSSNLSSCPHQPTNDVEQCHKFEQSVLNILLAKIFRHRMQHIMLPKGQSHIGMTHEHGSHATSHIPSSTSQREDTTDKKEVDNSR